jgi:hypothetical protein
MMRPSGASEGAKKETRMDFKEAESKYFELRRRLETGRLSLEEFQALVGELMVRDADGHYWAIDAQKDGWLRYDGANWVPAQPPAEASSPAPPTPGRSQGRGRASGLLIAAVAVALVLCLAVLAGLGLIFYRYSGVEEDVGVTRQEATEIADDIILQQFPDLKGVERTVGSYENLSGTQFWTVTYHREVSRQVEGETYSIPRLVTVSVDRETGKTITAVSN